MLRDAFDSKSVAGVIFYVLCLTYCRLCFSLCLSPVFVLSFTMCITLICHSCANKRGHCSFRTNVTHLFTIIRGKSDDLCANGATAESS